MASLVEGPLDFQVAGRIVAETKGCPLAIIELAGELSSDELSGGRPLPDRKSVV